MLKTVTQSTMLHTIKQTQLHSFTTKQIILLKPDHKSHTPLNMAAHLYLADQITFQRAKLTCSTG